jgi:hypothetical protein
MSTIKSSTTTTTAYSVEADTTGALVIQTGATPTTAITVSSAQVVTLANALPVASGGTGSTTSAGSAFALKGANSDITSLSGLTTVLSQAQGGTGTTIGYNGFKNRIINGAIGISQRVAVNTAVAVSNSAAGTYGPDRFYGYSGTLSLWNIYQATTGAYDFPYAFRTQRIAGQTSTTACYFGQTIETNNCIDLAGQSVTLSFYATAGANYSGGAAAVQILTGTAANQGTSSLNSGTWTGLAVPINDFFTPTTTRTRFTFTATLGSTVQEVAFRFNWSGSGTAGANDYIDITGVQLEKGSTATSFDYRPFGVEAILCYRYYWQYSSAALSDQAYFRSPYVSSAPNSSASVELYFPVVMRASPTLVGSISSGSINRQTSTTNVGVWQMASTSAATPYYIVSYTASIEL